MASSQVRPHSRLKTWTIAGLLVLGAGAYLFIPAVSENVHRSLAVLSMGDMGALRAYILSFGIWAPVASGVLMILQAVIAPLPAFVITLANGTLFGAFWGGLLSWSSALAAALICFFIADGLGRPVVERLVGQAGIRLADRFFRKHGKYAVFVARLIPIVPFDPISYGAGLTRMSVVDFALATGLGMIPAVLVYSWLGEQLGMANIWVWAVIAVSVLLAGSLVFRVFARNKDGGGGEVEEGSQNDPGPSHGGARP